jgi:hypothetical protein
VAVSSCRFIRTIDPSGPNNYSPLFIVTPFSRRYKSSNTGCIPQASKVESSLHEGLVAG